MEHEVLVIAESIFILLNSLLVGGGLLAVGLVSFAMIKIVVNALVSLRLKKLNAQNKKRID
jgi:hypothetical protein